MIATVIKNEPDNLEAIEAAEEYARKIYFNKPAEVENILSELNTADFDANPEQHLTPAELRFDTQSADYPPDVSDLIPVSDSNSDFAEFKSSLANAQTKAENDAIIE